MCAVSFTAAAHTSPGGLIAAGYKPGCGLVISYHAESGTPVDVMTLKCAEVSAETPGEVSYVDYMMLTGKRSHCHNCYRPVTYYLADGSKLELRMYDDGVVWKSHGATCVDMHGAMNRWLQTWSDCYEGFYPLNPPEKPGARWGYPALFEYPGGVYSLLTESGMHAGCAASSMRSLSGGGYMLQPDGEGYTGWQTLIVGTIADVVESTLVTDNSAPCALSDTSWIQPGVASWIYWAHNHGSNDYDIICRYVDMAVALGWPYTLIDAEWDEMKNGKTIEDAVAYARDRGVKPIIWYNSSVGWVDGAPGPKFRLNAPDDMEREFEWCERIGVAGVKIDFFSGDNNRNISYKYALMESAARHRLMVNFHGATIPRGWQRTYPNLMTTEAVYGAEWYNNVPTFTEKAAWHNTLLPFTRNVIGSMDYTPCAFSDSQHPHITSHAHELALTVLFESGIQHIADRPESICSQPREVRYFLSHLPVAWDDTVFLDGYPGEYVVLARRKGAAWYVAGINGADNPRDVCLDLKRLNRTAAHNAELWLYNDDESGEGWSVTSPGVLPDSIHMCARGGFVLTM